MKAARYTRYGAPDVLKVEDVPTPVPGAGEVLVRVVASSVTTADWRFRASAFPGILWPVGRAMAGLWRPRNQVPGMEFAGEVAAQGAGANRFAKGARVFGMTLHGANAEYMTIPQDGAIAEMPDTIGFAEAASLPFGAVCAMIFLRDFAQLRPGAHVLINGASGGVGVYAVQMAKALGARVTGVASARNHDLVRDLGASDVIDYRTTDPVGKGRRYDLVFDTVGSLSFRRARRAMGRNGLFLPLNFAGREMLQALTQGLRRAVLGGPRIKLAINEDSQDDIEAIAKLVRDGAIRPVIDRCYPLSEIVAAHTHVDSRRRSGAVIVEVQPPLAPRQIAAE